MKKGGGLRGTDPQQSNNRLKGKKKKRKKKKKRTSTKVTPPAGMVSGSNLSMPTPRKVAVPETVGATKSLSGSSRARRSICRVRVVGRTG